MGGTRKLLRGHYNPTTRSRKYPNLQFSKIGGVRKLICVQCIRTQNKKPRTKKAAAKTGN